MTYQEVLDALFASYLSVKPSLMGKHDRETRDPALILSFLKDQDLLPPPEKTIVVTGSKGKGTTSRLIAQGLQDQGYRVGLVTSPEVIDHYDRMSCNGQTISPEVFAHIYENLAPSFPVCEAPRYLSPYGLFLAVALRWFQDQKVDVFVIETGRGVRYDEGGQLSCQVGVVTRILLEHPSYIGPDLALIRADKLSLQERARHFVQGEDVTIASPSPQRPAWFYHNQAIAQRVITLFSGQSAPLPECPVPSFALQITLQGGAWGYEGAIAPESFDQDFLKQLITQGFHFYLSLPDDKNCAAVFDLFDHLQAPYEHIIMTGERGVLSYNIARSRGPIAYEGPYDDAAAFRAALPYQPTTKTYFIGTQTFLRLIKQSYHDCWT